MFCEYFRFLLFLPELQQYNKFENIETDIFVRFPVFPTFYLDNFDKHNENQKLITPSPMYEPIDPNSFRNHVTLKNRNEISGRKAVQTGGGGKHTHYLVKPIHSSVCSRSKTPTAAHTDAGPPGSARVTRRSNPVPGLG